MTQITEIQDVLKKYRVLLKDIDLLIKESGYRPSYFADRLNLSRSAFYAKRKNGTFTIDEMDLIANILLVSSEMIRRTKTGGKNRDEPETYTDEGFPSDQEVDEIVRRVMSTETPKGREALLRLLNS